MRKSDISIAARSWAAGLAVASAALLAPTDVTADPILTILHGFSEFEGGYLRSDRLVTDRAGNLYAEVRDNFSLTRRAFKLAPDGATYTVLEDFPVPENEYVKYAIPLADNRRNIYFDVTSYPSSAPFDRTIHRLYKLAANGSSYELLHTFSDGSPWPTPDYNSPVYGLIADSVGNLFGTTRSDSVTGNGTLFRLSSDGTLTVVHTFKFSSPATDGFLPSGGLTTDSAGNLYGMTSNGGTSLRGTVYKLTRDGKYSVLHSFCREADCRDGSQPVGELVIDNIGDLYGTTEYGGDPTCEPTPGIYEKGCGTLFRLTKDGTFAVLHAFKGGIHDGKYPRGGLIVDGAGTLYGMTLRGGAGFSYAPGRPELGTFPGFGTIYKLEPDGTGFTLLHSFSQDDDLTGNPASRLTADSAGNLYGIALTGPDDPCFRGYSCGTVFKLSGTGFVTEKPAALKVTPDTGIVATAAKGGGTIFSASSFPFAIAATSGSLKVEVSGVPSWLGPSFTSATVTAGSPLTETFSLGNLASLPRGTYNASISFTNATNNQGSTTRSATLRIYEWRDCLKGGWQSIASPPGPFENQGRCVATFGHLMRSR